MKNTIDQPNISVILPIYNAEKYIAQCIDNLLSQSESNIEIIIILDAPTDNTESILDKIAPRYSQIKLIRLQHNSGPSVARNTGVRAARGKYLHFMDADDLINTDFYKSLLTAAESSNSDVAIASYYNERFPNATRIYHDKIIITNNQDKLDYTNVHHDGYLWRYLIRREFYNQNKFALPEKTRSIEDLYLMIQIVCAANHIATAPNAVYFYKHRENSILSTGGALNDKNYWIARATVDEFMTDKGLIDNQLKLMRHERIKLFGRITILRKKSFTDGTVRIYLGGLQIMKITA